MRRSVIFLCLPAVAFLFINCSAKSNGNRVYFFKDENRAIIVPVKINDSITGNMLFDTGAPWDALLLDSLFCAEHNLPEWESKPHAVYYQEATGFHPSGSPKRPRAYYHTSLTINLSGTDITYPYFLIEDTKKDFTADVDGTIGFPKNDSTHVWELNFDHDYLEIHQADNFKMPENCYILPLVEKEGRPYPYIQFPVQIQCADGDTITVNQIYMIDTGLLYDLVLLPQAEEYEFFSKRDDAILISRHGTYASRYNVNTKVFDNFEIDSMRIYTVGYSDRLPESGLIGLNFLKRFNVFFDFSKNQVGFQPIKNFKRIVNQYERRFYFSQDIKSDGRQFVKKLAETKNNPYKKAGLEEGDEIIAINGFKVKNMTPEEAASIRNNNTKEIDILRNGEPIRITAHIDESENKGE